MAIGDYVHAYYKNYLKYGTSQNDEKQKPQSKEIFINHEKNIKASVFHRKSLLAMNNVNKKEIEKQLNYFFDAQKRIGPSNLGEISQKDLELMFKAVNEHLQKELKKVSIDPSTLSSVNIINENIEKVISAMGQEAGQELINILKNFSKSEIGARSKESVYKSTIEDRLKILSQIRQSITGIEGAKELINKLESLERQWYGTQEQAGIKDMYAGGSKINKNIEQTFINDLNATISSFLGGSSTVHGVYAETIVILTNYILNAKALGKTNFIMADFLKALETNSKGTKTSAKGLKASNFSKDFVDLGWITGKIADANGNYFSAHETQDKVDVEIEVKGLKIPASIKNYNLQNTYMVKDVHLLSGRSVLALVQDYDVFLNHYLNVVSNHPDKEPNTIDLTQAHEAMKLTILLKALEGGVFSNKKYTDKAELFIINDNSQGKFKVYYISDILDEVSKKLEYLKTGEYDEVTKLNNDWIGVEKEPNMSDAKVRISNLLKQLHGMALDVSVSKQIFLDKT